MHRNDDERSTLLENQTKRTTLSMRFVWWLWMQKRLLAKMEVFRPREPSETSSEYKKQQQTTIIMNE